MSAFLQTLSVRFAGRPPARPSRTCHPFHRGHVMPKENLGAFGGGAESPETAGNRVGVGRATLTRRRRSPPRQRRSGARRLLAADGLGPGPCSTGLGMLLRCLEKADI